MAAEISATFLTVFLVGPLTTAAFDFLTVTVAVTICSPLGAPCCPCLGAGGLNGAAQKCTALAAEISAISLMVRLVGTLTTTALEFTLYCCLSAPFWP